MTDLRALEDLTGDDDPTTEIAIIADPPAPDEEEPRPDDDAETQLGKVDTPAPDGLGPLSMVGIALSVIGALVVLFIAYTLFFTDLHAERAQDRLLSHLQAGSPTLYEAVPPEGKPVATLSIPALHLHQVVVEGTSVDDLESGPGLMPDTAVPGTAGNAVIAGRRQTFGHPFAYLNRLQIGQRIQVTDAYGRFTYTVISKGSVLTGHTDPISPTDTARLTLITSNSSLWPTGRYAVEAKLAGRPVAAVATNQPEPPLSERALGGDNVAAVGVIVWGELFVLGLVVTALVYRRWRQPLATYLLSTPILLALAVLTFENAVRMLPATL
jgi:sortase A